MTWDAGSLGIGLLVGLVVGILLCLLIMELTFREMNSILQQKADELMRQERIVE